MSGKYSSKNNSKQQGKYSQSGKSNGAARKSDTLGKAVWIIGLILIIALALVLIFLFTLQIGEADPIPTDPDVTETQGDTGSDRVQIDQANQVSINVGYGLYITDVAKYTGIYMEDGSDDVVSGIMMIRVTNQGEQDVQYADIQLPVGGETARFKLTTLPVGESVILLEQNRMAYADLDYVSAIAENVVLFSSPLSLHEDKLEIKQLNGAVSVTNISGEAIPGDIVIYYKNSAEDVYYGGITYTTRITGGLKAGETRQVIVGHMTPNGSTVVFVAITQ